MHITIPVFSRRTYSLLLLGLGQSRRRPSDDDGVDRVSATRKDEERHITRGNVQRRRRQDETRNGNTQAHGDVPRPLMQPSRAPAEEDTRGTSKDKRWAGKHKCDRAVETKRVDDGGEEGVERASGKVEVLHEAEQPGPLVCASLLEPLPRGSLLE